MRLAVDEVDIMASASPASQAAALLRPATMSNVALDLGLAMPGSESAQVATELIAALEISILALARDVDVYAEALTRGASRYGDAEHDLQMVARQADARWWAAS